MITSIEKYKLYLESVLKRGKDHELFDYKGHINDLWRPIIQEAQKFQHINFDLENNDSTNEKRTINIGVNLRKDQPVKNTFNIELCEAGGDWEYPVMYFKIEFTHQYGLISSDYYSNKEYVWDLEQNVDSRKFVIIPPIEAGNKLKKYENGFTAFTSSEDINANWKITDKDKKLSWKWIENLLNKLVKDRHKMLD